MHLDTRNPRHRCALPARGWLCSLTLLPLTVLGLGCTAQVKPSGGTSSASAAAVGGANSNGIQSAGGGGSTVLGSGGCGAIVPTTCNQPYPGEAPIRRLTRAELNNMLADLLGDKSRPADLMPTDSVRFSYETSIQPHGISAPLVDQYMQVAEKVSLGVLSNLDSTLPCQPANGEESCAQAYIAQLCKGAFRRSCSAEDTAPLFAMWQKGRAAGDFKTGIQYLVEMVLQSADFLYRPEFGDPASAGAGFVKLSGSEVATRLSYYLWSTEPDAALTMAADAGQLATKEGVATQAKRMLQDPRAHEAVQRFHEQWLGLDALATVAKSDTFTGFNAARPLLKAETRAFVDALFTENSDLGTLLSAPYSYSNDALESFYGLPSPGSAQAFKKVPRDATRYAGILTQGSFLAVNGKLNQSAPVMRGVQVLRQVLCADLPAPPPNLKITIPPPTADTTTRARFEQHENDPACSSCHQVIDRVGFGFEHFDAVGRWRDKDNNLLVDASGALMGTDVDGPFNGAGELGQKLANSEQVRSCYLRNVFYNVHGRPPTAPDRCSLEQLQANFKTTQYTLQDLAVAVTQTDAFLYRTPVTP